jgi:hypothetical protein
MPEPFDELFDGLRQAGEGLQRTLNAFQKAASAALDANAKYQDVNETRERVEAELLASEQQRAALMNELNELRAEIRALRERLNGNTS